jgi:hypothetical protein
MAPSVISPITLADLPETLTFQEVIDKYCSGASLRSMKEAATAGKFEHIRIGRAWLMTPAQIAAYLEYRVKKPQQPKPAPDRRASTRARHLRKTTKQRQDAA